MLHVDGGGNRDNLGQGVLQPLPNVSAQVVLFKKHRWCSHILSTYSFVYWILILSSDCGLFSFTVRTILNVTDKLMQTVMLFTQKMPEKMRPFPSVLVDLEYNSTANGRIDRNPWLSIEIAAGGTTKLYKTFQTLCSKTGNSCFNKTVQQQHNATITQDTSNQCRGIIWETTTEA